MTRKLLVTELWALGDLVLATPFLRAAAASGEFQISLLAKPPALELQPRLWPGVQVIPFVFPWTAFRGKYVLHRWPWSQLWKLARELRAHRFDIGATARRDARDHVVLRLSGARQRIGFPHLGSGLFLTQSLDLPPADAHRYENWRGLGRALGLELPPMERAIPPVTGRRDILLHSGAAQPARIWPLERFDFLVKQLRGNHYQVRVICDAQQRPWWTAHGEPAITPVNLAEFFTLLDTAGLFVGNDSGPGHLAGILGIPTFSLFGNQFPGRFAPLGPSPGWVEGGPCPFKPCYDSCRFPQPNCLLDIGQEQAWLRLRDFAARHLPPQV